MSQIGKWGTIFLGGLIAIALATTLTKKGSNTSGVINSSGTAISNTLSAAEGNS